MNEKRRAKRYIAHMDLNVSKLFKQDSEPITGLTSPIKVTNISRVGVGFESKDLLPNGYYFNAALHLGEEQDTLYCVIRIVRQKELGDGVYEYGAEFVGMPSVLNYIFEEYEEVSEEA